MPHSFRKGKSMKKLAIAAALAAMVSTVNAQSVSIYGVFDNAVRQDSAANAAGGNRTDMYSGVQSTSRLGFRGTEDLGNGLSARFVLEGGINTATGASSQNGSTGSILFDRFAYVAVGSKTAGELQLGRNTGATIDIAARGITDPLRAAMDGVAAPVVVSNATYGVSSARINQSIYAYGNTNGLKNSRADGMLKYVNKFGPVGVIAGYSPGGVAGSDSASTATTFGATVDAGPATLGAAQFIAKDATGKKATSATYGGTTKFGAVTLTAGYHTVESDAGYVASHLTTTATATTPILGLATTAGPSTEAKIASVGVRYELSPKFATTLAYYDGEYKNGLGSKGDLKTTVLFNEYNLSKRTNLYGIIDHAKASNDLVATTKSTNVGITAGIRHTF